MKKFIYIDTKIKGAIIQLLAYYTSSVFDKNTIILFKIYNENKKFLNIFRQHKIKYIPIYRYKDIPSLENAIIFYLFNAQSNCRLVAYREAIHVFVTHGESNKVSTIKPIMRIYDYITVAGNGGIDRYLENKIFYKDDLDRNRLIRMGSTFIGNPNYQYNEKSKNILYAPTWEGGVIEENYSSIDKDLNAFKLLDNYISVHNIDEIYMQPHPNLGHRDKRYIVYLIKGIQYLLKKGHSVNIVNYRFKLIHNLLFLKSKGKLTFINNFNNPTDMFRGFVDISAMEIQLISVDLPTYVFFLNSKSCIPKSSLLDKHYNRCGIFDFNYKEDIYLDNKVKDYYISYADEVLVDYNQNQKLNWLCDFIFQINNMKRLNSLS